MSETRKDDVPKKPDGWRSGSERTQDAGSCPHSTVDPKNCAICEAHTAPAVDGDAVREALVRVLAMADMSRVGEKRMVALCKALGIHDGSVHSEVADALLSRSRPEAAPGGETGDVMRSDAWSQIVREAAEMLERSHEVAEPVALDYAGRLHVLADALRTTPPAAPSANAEAVPTTLTEELRRAINRVSAENGSDTPDFILAEFLTAQIEAFNKAVHHRSDWYGHHQCIARPAPRVPEGSEPTRFSESDIQSWRNHALRDAGCEASTEAVDRFAEALRAALSAEPRGRV